MRLDPLIGVHPLCLVFIHATILIDRQLSNAFYLTRQASLALVFPYTYTFHWKLVADVIHDCGSTRY